MKKITLDYGLILATAAVLFSISLICIYGMFHFKLMQINLLPETAKNVYLSRMNQIVTPFLIALLFILSVCIPKRLMAIDRLLKIVAGIFVAAMAMWYFFDLRIMLSGVLGVSLIMQFIVFILSLKGSDRLRFERTGYWIRVGSSLIHLGIILFVFDLFFFPYHTLHLVLFWLTTVSLVAGMTGCFYSEFIIRLLKRPV